MNEYRSDPTLPGQLRQKIKWHREQGSKGPLAVFFLILGSLLALIGLGHK